MDERSRFYTERDRRSIELGLTAEAAERPIAILVGADAAVQRDGQILVLALCNLAARAHREIHLVLPSAPLLATPLVAATDLREAAVRTVRAIDPFCRVALCEEASNVENSVGIGHPAEPARWYVGATGCVGTLARGPTEMAARSYLGAGMAACLAAAAVFRVAHDMKVEASTVSAWDGTEGAAASRGLDLPSLDVGDVAMIGAGAVGSALQYWLREIRLSGRWTVVDGDVVEMHNTSRGMCMLPVHAGWNGRAPTRKIDLFAGSAINGFEGWYEDWHGVAGHRPDLILPLANERGVREAVAHRHEPIVLHATTSRSWQAQLHRHVAGSDDCIACRVHGLPGPSPAFPCSSGPTMSSDTGSNDAALPFLSAAAGLLLLAALQRLERGVLDGPWNQVSIHFDSAHRATQRSIRRCRDACPTALPDDVRQALPQRSRWATKTAD